MPLRSTARRRRRRSGRCGRRASVTGAGVARLREVIFSHVAPRLPQTSAADAEGIAEHAVYRPIERASYEVSRLGAHAFAVSGPAIDRLIARHDLENPEAL